MTTRAERSGSHCELAKEIDYLWDRLSAAYAIVRGEVPEGALQDEMRRLQAMLRQRMPEPGS